MRKRQWVVSVVAIAIAMFGAAAGTSARTAVDPTSLVPPLDPDRPCWQLGPLVQCDTSHDTTYANEPIHEAICGVIYESGEDRSTATRWYAEGLLVRRAVQEHEHGSWSLSTDGSGPTVEFRRDYSWDEHFAIPGDLQSGVQILKGATLIVPALGADLHESGQYHSDTEEDRGLHVSDDAAIDLLCPLLVG